MVNQTRRITLRANRFCQISSLFLARFKCAEGLRIFLFSFNIHIQEGGGEERRENDLIRENKQEQR